MSKLSSSITTCFVPIEEPLLVKKMLLKIRVLLAFKPMAVSYGLSFLLITTVRNRDEGYRDDNVLIGIDTYGDGRYMVSLGANPWKYRQFKHLKYPNFIIGGGAL